jgi:hypothetical protein
MAKQKVLSQIRHERYTRSIPVFPTGMRPYPAAAQELSTSTETISRATLVGHRRFLSAVVRLLTGSVKPTDDINTQEITGKIELSKDSS